MSFKNQGERLSRPPSPLWQVDRPGSEEEAHLQARGEAGQDEAAGHQGVLRLPAASRPLRHGPSSSFCCSAAAAAAAAAAACHASHGGQLLRCLLGVSRADLPVEGAGSGTAGGPAAAAAAAALGASPGGGGGPTGRKRRLLGQQRSGRWRRRRRRRRALRLSGGRSAERAVCGQERRSR